MSMSKLSNREFPFKVLKFENESVTLKNNAGRKTTLKINQEIESWSLMAVIERNGESIAVIENHREKDGPILYISPKGIIACFSKSLEPTNVPEESNYLGRTLKEILESDEDLLGEEILSREGDPSYEEVASCLPPMRKLGVPAVTSFVGTRGCTDKPLILDGIYTGMLTTTLVPAAAVPQIGRLSRDEDIYEGLVGGWLPVLRYKFESWEIIVFADPFPPTMWIQPVWFRFAKQSEEHIKDIHYFNTYIPQPPRGEPEPKQFYMKLLESFEDWQSVFEPAMEIDVPEERIANFCKHSLVREMITRIGDWPRYGVCGYYGRPEHGGFQDIFNSSVSAMLEWGLFDVARRYVDNYLSYFVRDDGSMEYRGPETGQYGRQLTMLAQYYNYTRDHALLLKHHRRIRAIVDLLLSLREEAKKLPKEDPAYGMIVGNSEADTCLLPNPEMYKIPYYSNSAEDLRGFHDLGKAWSSIGKRLSRQDLFKKGEELVRESEELKEDMYNSIEKSMLRDLVPPHLPGVAGAKKPYDKISLYKLCVNSRCYFEMLHSGTLTKAMVETIMRYQTKHRGKRLGIPSDIHHGRMVGFHSYKYGYGLLQHDLIREFLLLYYAHIAHLHTRGTWTATESRGFDSSEAEKPYATPAQVTIPCLTKWMLVFEDPNSSTVWLARGVPRRWLEDGKTIGVKGAPTKWGIINYEISSKMAQGKIKVELNLPEEGFGAEIHLRLRTPAKQKIQTVKVNGKPWTNFKAEEETVMLPTDSKGRMAIEVATRMVAMKGERKS